MRSRTGRTPGGPSQFTAPADAYTLPDAPSGLTATANGTNEIDLSWPEDDSNVDGYDLQRSDDDGTTFTSIAQLDPGTTSYTDTDVLDGTEYQYQLLADNGSGESNSSEVASATTDMAIPTGLTATSLDGPAIQLAWVNNSQSATSFSVQRSTDPESGFSQISLDSDGIDNGTATGMTYYYQVIATNDTTSSQPSAVASATAAVATIQAVDDTPATGVINQVTHGQTLTLYPSNLLANDTDLNTDPTLSIKSFTQPANGTLTDNGDGTYTYQSNASYTGIDSFTYTPTDEYDAPSNAATVQIQVTDNMPQAFSAQLPVVEATDSQGNYLPYPGAVSGTLPAINPDGDLDPLTYSAAILSGPGSFSYDSSTGAYTYTPSQTDQGPAVIVFTANDGALTSNKASLTFPGWKIDTTDPDEPDYDGDDFVAGQNLPTASNQYFSVNQGSSLQVDAPSGLLSAASDTDPQPDSDTLSVDNTLIESPQHGSVTINNTDGSFTYTPNVSFSGRDWFIWQVDDGAKKGDYATAFIDVAPVNVTMKLTVGGASDPLPPDTTQQATPFIPIDDGYDSDAQSVPNDQMNPPDSTDPELVPASLTMSSNVGMWGTWSLSFPNTVRVFQVQSDGTLTAVTSGQQSAPVQVGGSPLSFMVQDVGPAGAAAITATMTPASDPSGNPPPNTQPTTRSVPVTVAPSPLQVLSVKNNAAGTALTTAQQQKSGTIYVPVSDAADGLVYKLPLVIHNLTVTAELLGVPIGMTILDSNGNPLQATPAPAGPPQLPNNPAAVAGILLSPSPGNDIDLYVEFTEKTGPVTLTLAQVNKNHQLGTTTPNGLQMFPTLGKAVITPFLLSHVKGSNTSAGPMDVPQFGTYEYKVTDVPGGQWLATDSGIPVQPIGNNASDVNIPWGGGPSVDQAIYQADPQYIWDLAVNIFQITVNAGPNGAASGGTTVVQIPQDKKGSAPGLITVTTISTFNMDASVTVVGPNGTAGIQHLSLGFVQNLAPVATKAEYANAGGRQGAEVGSTLLGGGTIDMGSPPEAAFWDTQNTSRTVFYSDDDAAKITGTQLLKNQTNEITTLDAPKVSMPRSWSRFGGMDKLEALWNLSMYVVVRTDETPSVYVPEAYLPWTFNGTGNVNGNVWTGNGSGISFRTQGGTASWVPLQGAAAGGEPPFNTAGHQFNSLIQNAAENSAPTIVLNKSPFP